MSDLLNPPFPGSKLFEELVLDFNVSRRDRRKFNFLMKCIPCEWLKQTNTQDLEVVPTIIEKLINARKVPRYAYNIMIEKCIPKGKLDFWSNSVDVPQNVTWEKIHTLNFNCTIDTRLRSFYFKIFHNAIAFNAFLYRIKRKNSPNCTFCKKMPETLIHVFCDCEIVSPIWQKLVDSIRRKHAPDFVLTNFGKLFGVVNDKYLSFLILSLKYFIHVCKFTDKTPVFTAFVSHLNIIKETEYYLAKKKGKLPSHFKKWSFDL